MRRRILLLVLLLSLLVLAGFSQSIAQGSRVRLLQVFDAQPSPSAPLGLNDSVALYFNRRVGCREAEAAFSVRPALSGELRCDQFSLSFTPVGEFERDRAYTFAITPPLRALDGAPLLDPYEATYTTAGYLFVSEVFPSAQGGPAPVDSAITVVFDRPVVPLTLPSEVDDLPQPLSIEPATAGKGEWVNSAVYTFAAESPLKSGQTYSISIASDLAAVDGAEMEAGYSWTFETAKASIVAIDPPLDTTSLGLEPKLQVRFNQVMDRGAIEDAFYLRLLPAGDDSGLRGEFVWAEDGMGFAFRPEARLELDSLYEAGFSPEMQPELQFGSAGATPGWRYQTVPEPSIVATEPTDGAQEVSRGGFSLFFASMMNISTLADRITIEPEPLAPPRVYYSEWAKRYTVSFDAAPSTAYAIRIAPGMEDIYGNAIAEPTVFRYTTAARTPMLGFHVPGPVGYYNAYSKPTQLIAQHRGADAIDFALYHVPLQAFVSRMTNANTYDPTQDYGPRAGDLLKTWRVETDAPENVQAKELLELRDGRGRGLEPGVYYIEATAPGFERFTWQNRHFLNVATAVLTIKQATDRLTIWAADLDSGAPIIGERIAIYGRGGASQGSGVTDERGIVQIDIPVTPDLFARFVAVMNGSEHFGIGYTEWSNGTEPWQFGYGFSWSPRAYQAYLYTDRPVYRSGQPVYFRGVLRSKDDVVYMPAPLDTAAVVIRDARGEIVYQRELAVSDFGSFNGQFDIAPDASLGAYSLSVDLPAEREYGQEGGSISFLVAEYRLPEYQVTLSAEQPEIVQGGLIALEVEGKYFFGGPVSNASGDYALYSSAYAFDYRGEGRYDFADYDLYQAEHEPYGVNRIVSEGSLTTDAEGKARLEWLGDLQGESQSRLWRVEASIRDEAGSAIYGSASLVVHQGLLYLGARAADYVGLAGEDSVIELIAVDWDSRPVADQPIHVQVVERRWSSVQEQDPSTGATAWTWDVEEIPVADGSVISGADGKADFVFQPSTGGIYKIIVATRDSAGNQVRAATYAWVSGPDYVSWRQRNDNAIDLRPEQTVYSVGDRAKILIASPFQGETEALISIERGDVLHVEQVTLTSNSQIYEFEILPQYAPNIFVSVFLIKPADEQNAAASWRIGMTQLAIDIEQKALNIEISADRDTASPQEIVKYQLRVTDYQGDPVVAEVGIGLTDLAALSLAERNSQPILDAFFGPQELSIRTSSSLVVNADAATEAMSERKGGGGGLFEAGIVDLRGEFIDTAYWSPSVVTDAAGLATIDVRLPDNLTTWRLDARALTEGRAGRLLVGERTYDLRSTRPLLIRPVTPRFFVVGDKAQLAAVINNNTGTDVSASVSLETGAGLILADESSRIQDVMIPAGGRQRLTWLATVADVDTVAPSFIVRSQDGAFSDASISPVSADRHGTLPVYRYLAPATVGTAGMLAEAGARVEALRLPQDQAAIDGRLEVRLDKSLAGLTEESLTYLGADTQQYRACAGAVVSRVLPSIVALRALDQMGITDADSRAKLDGLVTEGLQELYARQLADGGWSWCSYPQAHPLTTAYALLGLAEAAAAGYPVDAAVIGRARSFIRQALIRPSMALENWRLNRQAFFLYALARSGAADAARSTTLFESRERLNLDAIAFLAQTLHSINPEDDFRLEALTQLMLNRAVSRATGTFFEETYQDRWNWSSDTRSTALVLNALIKLRPESELLPNIVRHLASARVERGGWGSRQDDVWSIIALTNWMLHTGEFKADYAYSVSVNGSEILRDAAMPAHEQRADELSLDFADLRKQETNTIEFERGAGEGALYYRAHLHAQLPVDDIPAVNRGIDITRSYSLLGDGAADSIHSAAIGETVQVRLRLVVPHSLRYVVIEDFFPAGAEAINPELAISPQLGTLPAGARIDPRESGWGWWHFDHVEFRDEKAVIYASHLPPGVYEYVYTIRPTVAGEYQVLPPVARQLYFPEVFGRGAGRLFTISD